MCKNAANSFPAINICAFIHKNAQKIHKINAKIPHLGRSWPTELPTTHANGQQMRNDDDSDKNEIFRTLFLCLCLFMHI